MSIRVKVMLALALVSGWAFAVHHRSLARAEGVEERGGEWVYFGAQPERLASASGMPPAGSGTGVLRLVVGPVTEEGGVDWGAWSQVFPCRAGDRLEASVEVLVEDVIPPAGVADCHLEVRLDFFADEEGVSPLPTRAGLSVPYIPGQTAGTGEWTRVVVGHRVPDEAMSVRVSIVAWLRGETGGAQTFWLDDAEMKRTPGRSRERSLWNSGGR